MVRIILLEGFKTMPKHTNAFFDRDSEWIVEVLVLGEEIVEVVQIML